MSIARFSVKNPVLVNILMFAILALGFFSLTRLPREQFSEVPLFFVNVIVPYPGVSAEDVETSVTVPIENAMAGIDSLRSLRSTTREGLSTVTLQFDDGLSNDRFERLFQQVQTRFTTVTLPSGTLQASIADFSSNDFLPVIEVVLSGDVPFATLDATARSLASRIEGRNDVSGVDLIGVRDRRIVVSIDQARLVALGIPVTEVSQAIQGRNVTIPGGTIANNGNEFLLRTVGGIERVDEFERIVVRRTPDGVVRLGDVASIAMEFESAGVVSRFNGEDSVSLRVNKVPRGNSIGVIDSVRDEIAFLTPSTDPGIRFTLTNDSTIQIRDSINVLLTNAILGLGLLVVILFLFIGLRNALITAIGIPITFAATFIVLELLGETFNSNTLFGMVLVLGLIVDHSIVIVENSYRRQQLGLSRHRAAIEGTNEVIIPVFAATATTVAAFLPLTLLPGVIGLFLRVVPLTVSIALIISTFEAAFFLPSHYADWPGGKKEPKRAFFEAVKKRFGVVITNLYRFRGVTVAVIVVVMIGVFSLVPFIGQDLFSAEDFTLFYIEIELPAGSSRDRTDRVVGRYEQRLLPLVGNGEIVSINSTVGFSQRDNQTIRRNNVAQIVVDLAERAEGRERSITDVLTDVQNLTYDIPGAEVVQFRRAQNGPPTDPPVSFRFFGDSYDELAIVTGAVRDRLDARADLVNVEDNLDAGTPELRIIVDEERAMQLGLSTQAIGSFIRTTFDGLPVSTVFLDNEQYDVIVTYAGLSTIDASAISQISIPTPDGRFIPFSAVARIDDAEALASINRFDGRREVTITADALSTANLRELNRDIEQFFTEEFGSIFPGMTLRIGGDFAAIANLLIEILRIFLIGVFLIYLILGAQFKSYTQPLLVLLSVPFAFVGVVLFLVVSGTPLSTTVIYASVALAGIAVNDTIVLVSFVNERRMAGASVREAVVAGATTRLRPILLTSVTTIAGLLPTAIGLGGRSVIWGPMASTIIFGLVFSTITALVVVPCVYGILFDTKRSRARFEKRRLLAAETEDHDTVVGELVGGHS
ncbi:MAG: efflux RND transporter permease subunit [Spirochaetaceae bacterium]|nr:MAG: efflux RND transporter permease subunit [Spirochaetaceae bacterium]